MTATVDRQRIFDALASPIRREILWLTWREERTVGDIATHFEVTAPTLSSHLTVLREAGLVDMTPRPTTWHWSATTIGCFPAL